MSIRCESCWRYRAEANEKWPENMEIVDRTEEIEVQTVCKEGETCDVDGKYKDVEDRALHRRHQRQQNHEHFMGCTSGTGWIQKTFWFSRR